MISAVKIIVNLYFVEINKPSEALYFLNDMLIKDMIPGVTISAVYMVINEKENSLEIAQAAQEYSYYISKNGVEKIPGKGIILGVIESEEIERKYMNSLEELFKNVNGILIPGGFGNRGIEGKIATIEYARTHKIPLFGICLGLQCAVIEFARHGCGMENANSTEFDPTTPYPVISLLEEQELIDKLGGTMRLGAYLCMFKDNTRIKSIYNTDSVMERHRHRFEFTLKYKQLFEKHGMIFSGFNPQSNLVETIEYADHPWFICTQFHPEFKSKPVKPHPLFKDFIRASMENIC